MDKVGSFPVTCSNNKKLKQWEVRASKRLSWVHLDNAAWCVIAHRTHHRTRRAHPPPSFLWPFWKLKAVRGNNQEKGVRAWLAGWVVSMPGCVMSLRIELVAALLYRTRRVVLSMRAVLLSGSLQLINNSNPTKMLVEEFTRAALTISVFYVLPKFWWLYHYRKVLVLGFWLAKRVRLLLQDL